MPPAPMADGEDDEAGPYPQPCHWYMATGKLYQHTMTKAEWEAYNADDATMPAAGETMPSAEETISVEGDSPMGAADDAM